MKKDIDILLNKYFDGETSLREEQVLKEYFSSSDVLSEHEVYRSLFVAFETEKKQHLSVPLKPAPVFRNRKSTIIKLFSASAAAVALLVVGLWFTTNQSNQTYAYIKGEKITESEFVEQYAINKLEEVRFTIAHNLTPLENIQQVKNTVKAGFEPVREVKETLENIYEKLSIKNINYEKSSNTGYSSDDVSNTYESAIDKKAI